MLKERAPCLDIFVKSSFVSVFERWCNLALLGGDGLTFSKVLTSSFTLALLDSPFVECEPLNFVYRYIVIFLESVFVMLFYLDFYFIFDVGCGTQSVVCDDLCLYDIS